MRLGTLREWIKYSLVLGVLLLVIPPLFTSAAGSAADAMCAKVNKECNCGEVKNKKTKKCEKKTEADNPYLCPNFCKDDTNGHKTVGHCVDVNKCKGDTCDGKPCEQSKPPEMPKMPEMPKDNPSQPKDTPCAASGASDRGVNSVLPLEDKTASTTSATSTTATSTPKQNPCPSTAGGVGSGAFGSAYSPDQFGGANTNFGGYNSLDPNSVFSDALSGLADQGSQTGSGGSGGFSSPVLNSGSNSLSSDSGQEIQNTADAIDSTEATFGVTGFLAPRGGAATKNSFTGEVLSAAKSAYSYAANVAANVAKAAVDYVYSAAEDGKMGSVASVTADPQNPGVRAPIGQPSSGRDNASLYGTAKSSGEQHPAFETRDTESQSLLRSILIGILSIIRAIVLFFRGIF